MATCGRGLATKLTPRPSAKGSGKSGLLSAVVAAHLRLLAVGLLFRDSAAGLCLSFRTLSEAKALKLQRQRLEVPEDLCVRDRL